MQLCKTSAFSVLTVVILCLSATVDSDIVNVSREEDASRYLPGLNPVLLSALDPLSSRTLSAAVAQDQEINQTCRNLATLFHDRYVAYADCLVKSARPVEVCLNCFEGYLLLSEVYANISNDKVNAIVCSCVYFIYTIFLLQCFF